MRDWFAALPADVFPSLVGLAPHLAGSDSDTRFEFGLTVLIERLALARA